MDDQTLRDISEQLIQIGHSLKNVTDERLTCIQSFNKCQKIVKWIRDTTKGLHMCVLCSFLKPIFFQQM